MSRSISFMIQYNNNKKATIAGLHNTKNSEVKESKFSEKEIKSLKRALLVFRTNSNKKAYKCVHYSINVSGQNKNFRITGKRKEIDNLITEFCDFIETVQV